MQGGLDDYFGGPDWRERYADAWRRTKQREEALRQTYLAQLKAICGFRYVATTRVRFEDQQRTYFYLAYGTRHPAGMMVFRETERKAVEVQEDLAYGSVIEKASAGGRMNDMLSGIENPNLGMFREWEGASRRNARAEFDGWLNAGPPRAEPDATAYFMQHPHVDLKTIKAWLSDAEAKGQLTCRLDLGKDKMLVPTACLPRD